MKKLTIACEGLPRAARQPIAAFWIGVAIFVALELVGASGGVRGSDQYWYLADLETLLEHAPRLTNTLFPRQLLRVGVEHAPFIHNIIPQYAPLPLAYLLGPYWGWIATNLVAMVFAAHLTRKAALPTSGPWLSTLLGLLVLLLPLSIWHGFQVLAEPQLMPIFALAVLLVERRMGLLGWCCLCGVLVLGFMSRFTGVALLAVCPFLVWVAPLPLRRKVLASVLVAAIAISGVLLNRWLFGAPTATGENPLASAIVTRGMDVWYYTGSVQLSVDAVKEKLLYSVGALIGGPPTNRFMLALNYALMLAAAGGAAIAMRRQAFVFALFVFSVIALNLATILLFSNQARYIVPVYPVLLVSCGYLLTELRKVRPRLMAVAGPLSVAALVALAVPMMLKGRNEGLKEHAERAQLTALSKDLRGPGDVLSLSMDSQILAYTFNPRLVLYTNSKQTDADWDRILTMPRWRWAFGQSPEIERLTKRGARAKLIRRLEFRGATYGLYELQHLEARLAW